MGINFLHRKLLEDIEKLKRKKTNGLEYLASPKVRKQKVNLDHDEFIFFTNKNPFMTMT